MDNSVAHEKQSSLATHVEHSPAKFNKNGIILVPQPSDDTRDPLNWPSYKKLSTLFIICLAAFASTISAQANTAGFVPQAILYDKSVVQLSYSLTASGLGLASGPFVWSPLSSVFGKSGMIFWSNLLALVCNIWSAVLTRPGQYVSFVLSRFFCSFFGSAATTMGASIIVEVFFLHDRGKCFALYATCLLIGSAAGATMSGYIVEYTDWPVQFWYNVGLEGFVALLCVAFLDEPGWTRSQNEIYPKLPEGFIARKAAIYLGTRRVTPRMTRSEFLRRWVAPFQVAISPTALLVGLAIMLSFSWAVGVGAVLSIFLQTPVEAGGYGFSPQQNAAFAFTIWVSVLCAQAYGHLMNDRLPLWFCKRRDGEWHPEYRLYPLYIPILIIAPVGLGLFGAAMKYHLHYMVLAFACFLINFADVIVVSPCNNYVVESIGVAAATEAATALNFYRLILGTLLPLFVFPWIARVGVNWAFGTMAFLTVSAFGIFLCLMIWGRTLRKYDLGNAEKEDGIQIVRGGNSEEESNN